MNVGERKDLVESREKWFFWDWKIWTIGGLGNRNGGMEPIVLSRTVIVLAQRRSQVLCNRLRSNVMCQFVGMLVGRMYPEFGP